jgi:hypothetical protein
MPRLIAHDANVIGLGADEANAMFGQYVGEAGVLG